MPPIDETAINDSVIIESEDLTDEKLSKLE